MNIIKCCDMFKDFTECKYIDIVYDKEMIFIGDIFANYRMKYCLFCGKEIKFINIFSIEEDK